MLRHPARESAWTVALSLRTAKILASQCIRALLIDHLKCSQARQIILLQSNHRKPSMMMMQTASELSISLSASLASTSSISDPQLLRIKTTPVVLEANTTQGSFIIPSSNRKVLTTSHSRIIVKTYSTADSAATMLRMIESFK